MIRRITGVVAMIAASLFVLAGAQGASAAKTVEISGRAFVFNHMNTGISNATIKVREFPKLSANANEFGDYTLRVPDNADVTPYIESGGPTDLTIRDLDDQPTGTRANVHWNEIDLQTFHTRGEDIENANFQSPQDAEYNGLKAILKVPARADGRPEQCAIVTTSSARNVRDTDFRTYWVNTPHGVEGATSMAFPALPAPTYFNQYVIPDANQPHSSHDGGIIWPVVPTGTYRIVTSHPDTKFASFLATCAPGRIVNANPPMGAYQLNPGEKPRTFSNVAGKVVSAKAILKGKNRRFGSVVLKAGERLDASVTLKAGGGASTKSLKLKPGTKTVKVNVDFRRKWKKATLVVRLKDASGVAFKTVRKVNLPKASKKKTKKAKGKPAKRK